MASRCILLLNSDVSSSGRKENVIAIQKPYAEAIYNKRGSEVQLLLELE
jgi:hypothetical protein